MNTTLRPRRNSLVFLLVCLLFLVKCSGKTSGIPNRAWIGVDDRGEVHVVVFTDRELTQETRSEWTPALRNGFPPDSGGRVAIMVACFGEKKALQDVVLYSITREKDLRAQVIQIVGGAKRSRAIYDEKKDTISWDNPVEFEPLGDGAVQRRVLEVSNRVADRVLAAAKGIPQNDVMMDDLVLDFPNRNELLGISGP